MTLVLYKNIDLCLALKKWNDYMGWGRILYLDLWVWESKRNGSPILISSDPLIEEGQRQKKNDGVSKSELNVKKNMLSSLSIPLILFLLFGGFFRFLFDFFLLRGPPLLYLQNLYKICLLPAIFILSKQSENLYVLHKIWLCLRIRHRFDISPAVPKL